MLNEVKDEYLPNIGLLCAMPEEIGSVLENLKDISTIKFGDL